MECDKDREECAKEKEKGDLSSNREQREREWEGLWPERIVSRGKEQSARTPAVRLPICCRSLAVLLAFDGHLKTNFPPNISEKIAIKAAKGWRSDLKSDGEDI